MSLLKTPNYTPVHYGFPHLMSSIGALEEGHVHLHISIPMDGSYRFGKFDNIIMSQYNCLKVLQEQLSAICSNRRPIEVKDFVNY